MLRALLLCLIGTGFPTAAFTDLTVLQQKAHQYCEATSSTEPYALASCISRYLDTAETGRCHLEGCSGEGKNQRRPRPTYAPLIIQQKVHCLAWQQSNKPMPCAVQNGQEGAWVEMHNQTKNPILLSLSSARGAISPYILAAGTTVRVVNMQTSPTHYALHVGFKANAHRPYKVQPQRRYVFREDYWHRPTLFDTTPALDNHVQNYPPGQ